MASTPILSHHQHEPHSPLPESNPDEWLFGWDTTPGIVSVWADRNGRALIWQREGERVVCSEERFRPWLFAATLDHVSHLGAALVADGFADGRDELVSYRELDGLEGEPAYRYLLSANSFRTIERAILLGAGRRQGSRVERLSELHEYYTLGPVEQYLMLTGRVYFRGLRYADIHRLQFDLETTALSPAEGRIFLVSVRDSSGFETVLEAPDPTDEARLIADLCALIRERDPDVIENHNLFGFDLPFLYERAQTLGVPLALGRREGATLLERYSEPSYRRRRGLRYQVAGRELIDTLEAVWRYDFTVRDMTGYGLKQVARYFGVASADRTYLPGHAIYRTYQDDPATVRRYALDDVREVDALSRLLLGAPFALAGRAPRPYQRVANAGPAMGILEPMLVRAYLRAGAALPRQSSDGDAALGRHSGGATYLFQGGVAKRVVKADIASMYPSIMRVYQIGPSGDRLKVLLRLVERLTDLRLFHKQAARDATPGSVEAGQHQAVQAAMKIMVNSAYGYMGAGAMALFADRHAADAVTSQGRAILDQVVAELKARGVALLEADTDGVFFAVPAGWDEAREREIVNAVAALLPSGLRLEYEGRYQAMLCHEVKNYALLTYAGEVIIRGGALRSSRSEPFGVQFLHQAADCLLRGDMAGLMRGYQDTVQAIRDHRLTLAQVATRARLAKSYIEYQRSQGRLREAPYEALLGAGRRDWEVGERVRFYRAVGGRFVWLPEEATSQQADNEGDDIPLASPRPAGQELPPYDAQHYLRVLHTSYVSRLRKAFEEHDFAQLFRDDAQLGLFDQPTSQIEPLWIEAPGLESN